MAIKLKAKLRSLLRRIYAWYISADVKTKAKVFYITVWRIFSFSWYKELNEKSRAKLHYAILRALTYLMLLAGVLGIAAGFTDFKDIKYSFKKDDPNPYVVTDKKYNFDKYYLEKADFQKEWEKLDDKNAEYPNKPKFAKKFKDDIEKSLEYSPAEGKFVNKTEINDKNYYVNKFVVNRYRFFLTDSVGSVKYSSWRLYRGNYAEILLPGKDITLNKADTDAERTQIGLNQQELDAIIDRLEAKTVDKIDSNYGHYIYKYPEPVALANGETLYLYIAVSDFNIIDTVKGQESLFFIIGGIVFVLLGIIINSRLSAKYKNDEKKTKGFNRNTITVLLAVYLLVGFLIVAAVFFIWYGDASYASYDTNRQQNWTYTLAVLYAAFTFITTSMIANGLSAAHQNAILLKKMKAELIANVSHDIKTPLTSIIGYINLLENEYNMSNEAKSYISVLKVKAERLKNIISDLFELSKSTSGNGELKLETLDLKKVVLQTLADMEDAITESGLQFVQSYPDKAVPVNADGKKLYRVFQNIIGNSLKYSLAGKPVTVLCRLAGKKAFVEIQNTANYKMNFAQEDILEKYTRGDGFMTEDGIGLGLSIADTFVKECGGDFRIKIEGDQFKVIVSFKTV